MEKKRRENEKSVDATGGVVARTMVATNQRDYATISRMAMAGSHDKSSCRWATINNNIWTAGWRDGWYDSSSLNSTVDSSVTRHDLRMRKCGKQSARCNIYNFHFSNCVKKEKETNLIYLILQILKGAVCLEKLQNSLKRIIQSGSIYHHEASSTKKTARLVPQRQQPEEEEEEEEVEEEEKVAVEEEGAGICGSSQSIGTEF
ncbi:hypothetical protein WN51_12916 [Melipona quadrifasciata]|uniref:Uncharacterized protein n=1 Tax=Melipona quadrifasciata TaxID=166423 RepID=A0A0M9ACF6_9HYME|nr:hypothetical protein WN51_12916 [Melipona quadrifasciata]